MLPKHYIIKWKKIKAKNSHAIPLLYLEMHGYFKETKTNQYSLILLFCNSPIFEMFSTHRGDGTLQVRFG